MGGQSRIAKNEVMDLKNENDDEEGNFLPFAFVMNKTIQLHDVEKILTVQ